VSKQVSLLLLVALALGCNQGSPTAPTVRRGAPFAVQRQGFDGWQVKAQGPHTDKLIKAQEALRNGNAEEAIEKLEELLKADPKNRQGLYFLAHILQDHGHGLAHGRDMRKGYAHFQRSAQCMRLLRSTYSALSRHETDLLSLALYNDACAEALYGEPDKALTALEDSIDTGFTDLQLMATDTDLKSLHKLPQFQALMERLRPM
jgi:tetratricopeptide (TPR) repeat protein